MKKQGFQKAGITLAAATLVTFLTPGIFAQDTNAFGQYEMPTGTPAESQTPPPEAPMAPVSGSTTPLSGPDMQILQLSQAKISDSTIVTYIQNSSTIYGLDASQIVYLKQNGVSEAVINAMLNQRTAVAQQQQQQQAQMPPPGSDQTAANSQTVVAQPSTPAPSTTYIVPDSQTANYNSWAAPYWYYPYYSSYYYPYSAYYYPYYGYSVYWPGIYWGWGRGYYGGYHGYYGGYHGYYGGGYHGYYGGGYHGGGYSGGGFHGGGGGHH